MAEKPKPWPEVLTLPIPHLRLWLMGMYKPPTGDTDVHATVHTDKVDLLPDSPTVPVDRPNS